MDKSDFIIKPHMLNSKMAYILKRNCRHKLNQNIKICLYKLQKVK